MKNNWMSLSLYIEFDGVDFDPEEIRSTVNGAVVQRLGELVKFSTNKAHVVNVDTEITAGGDDE